QQRLANWTHDRRERCCCAHFQRSQDSRPLFEGNIEDRFYFAADIVEFRITHDADDFHGLACEWAAGYLDLLSYRIGVVKVRIRHCLIDYHDDWRAPAITAVKIPAGDQVHPNRLKISGRYDVESRPKTLCGRRRGAADFQRCICITRPE